MEPLGVEPPGAETAYVVAAPDIEDLLLAMEVAAFYVKLRAGVCVRACVCKCKARLRGEWAAFTVRSQTT